MSNHSPHKFLSINWPLTSPLSSLPTCILLTILSKQKKSQKINFQPFFSFHTDKDLMAKTKSFGVLCMLLVLTLFIQDFAEGSSRGASQGVGHRKLFLELKKMALKNAVPKLATNEMPEDWELRRVPMGPDPLHHNGQDPKKPRKP